MSDIKIAVIDISQDMSEKNITKLFHLLPLNSQNYIAQFRRPIDKNLSILGYSLLSFLCKEQNIKFKELYRDDYNRPFLKNFSGDFSISRSNKRVICALSTQKKVGIDMEYIKPIELQMYQEQFSQQEWEIILHDNSPLNMFYTLWTKKEAIVKYDGRGLHLTLSDIPSLNETLKWKNLTIQVKDISFDKNYKIALACHHRVAISKIKHLTLHQLLVSNSKNSNISFACKILP